MFDRIRLLVQRLHEVQEVNALTDRDLDDLGMSRSQLHDFLRMPRDIGQRVMAMGAIFGVPEADLRRDQAQWVDLLTVCGHCADRNACAQALAHADDVRAEDCGFCGNRGTFAELASRSA